MALSMNTFVCHSMKGGFRTPRLESGPMELTTENLLIVNTNRPPAGNCESQKKFRFELFGNRLKQPKFSEKCQNMLSIKLFWLVFCLFWFNRNIKTLCFGIGAKQPKQTLSEQTETNRDNPKFSEKIPKICSPSNCFGCSFLFVSVQLNHQNSLIRYRRETT